MNFMQIAFLSIHLKLITCITYFADAILNYYLIELIVNLIAAMQ